MRGRGYQRSKHKLKGGGGGCKGLFAYSSFLFFSFLLRSYSSFLFFFSLFALDFFDFSSPVPASLPPSVYIGFFVDGKARVSRLLLGFQKIHIV